MRRHIIFILIFILLPACSSSTEVVVDSADSDGAASPETTAVRATVETDKEADEPPTAIPAKEKPAAPTTTTVPPSLSEVPVGLSLDDALLRDGAFDLPWEFQRRTLDRFTFEPGPQQTDCAEFWELEKIGTYGTAYATRWRDGANLDHQVAAFPSSDDAAAVMDAASRLAEACPVVVWFEGGKFSVSPVDVDFELDEVTSVAFVIDEGQEQRTWRVLSLRDNVISSLRIPTWPIPGVKPVTEAEVLDAGRHAAKLLAAAGPARREEAQTTTTTVAPVTEEDPDHLKPGVNTDPTPVEPLPKDLLAITLDDGDLSTDWEADELEKYRPNPTSLSDLTDCPEMAAFDAIDAVLVIERRFAHRHARLVRVTTIDEF